MSAQELIRKTKFEAQVPYTLIGEIAEAVKKSEERCPKFPDPFFLQMARIWDAVEKMGECDIDNNYSVALSGESLNETRLYALGIIAETIRFIKSLPPTPHTTDTRKASSES